MSSSIAQLCKRQRLSTIHETTNIASTVSKTHQCLETENDNGKMNNERNSSIYMLPNELLKNCLSYVGRGNYKFISTVSSNFHDCYVDLYKNCETWPSAGASDSLSCAILCFNQRSINLNECIFRHAAMKGHSDVVECAIKHRLVSKDFFASYSMSPTRRKSCLIQMGHHLNVLKQMHQHGFEINWEFCCYGAIKAQNTKVLDWMVDELKFDLMHIDFFPSIFGKLNVLKWALEVKGIKLFPYSWTDTIIHGTKETIEYCLSHTSPNEKPKESACEMAAKYRDLEILQCLREHSVPWNVNTSIAAVAKGKLDMLIWATSNGCPVDSCVYHWAIDLRDRKNHPKANEILAYLKRINCGPRDG